VAGDFSGSLSLLCLPQAGLSAPEFHPDALEIYSDCYCSPPIGLHQSSDPPTTEG
jgi:hypothetical protein